MPLAAILPLLLTAQPWEKGKHGGRLIVAQKAESKTLNPVLAIDAPSREAIRLLHADLISINRHTLRTEPALAESWTVSADGRQYRLKLRRGVHFSDGHPFDADDVVFTFQVYTDPKTAAPQRDLLQIAGKPVSARKVDTHTVVLELAGPYAAAERIFDGIAMLPRHLLEADYKAGRIAQVWNLATAPEKIAGLGPFRFAQYKPGEAIVLERNSHYWKKDDSGAPLPYLDEIQLRPLGAEDAQVLRFTSGGVDVLNRISARSMDALGKETAARQDIHLEDLGGGLESNFLFFNLNPATATHRAIFQNADFRRAVSAAIDREAIVRLVFGGKATPLWTHVTPANAHWVNRSLPRPAKSLDTARALMRKAGLTTNAQGRLCTANGKPLEFTILAASSSQERPQMATLVAGDLRELGIGVQVVTLELRALVDRVLNTKDYDACVLGIGGGDADPNPEMNVWLSSGSMHLWHPAQDKPATPWEAELDSLMREQMVTLDAAKRKRLFDRVQQIEWEQAPVIALASPNILVAARRRLGNFRPAILDPYTLWNAERLYWRSPK